jgi:hypothetical protein
MAIGALGVAAQRPGYPLHADLTSLRAVLPAAQEPERHAPQVARWAFDADLGHITGVDAHGRVLMSVAANPLFGPRLAAAFGAAQAWQTPAAAGHGRPALPC